MPTPRPLLTAVCAAVAVAAFAQAQKPAASTRPSTRIGQFRFSNDGGSLKINNKNRKRAIWEFSGPSPRFRSEGLDLDARHVRAEVEGNRVVRDGVADGAVKLVVRSPGQTDTLFCEKATLKFEADGITGRMDLTGGVRWLRTGPEIDGALETRGSRAVVTRSKGDDGPEIEIFDIDSGGTLREPAPKPKGKS